MTNATASVYDLQTTPLQSTRRQYVLTVEFESNSGERWTAVGGGGSIGDAIAFARDSAPDDRYWRAIKLTDVYGD